ncbi:hypothetical protein ACFLTS_01610 [Chloroflexota bacterium]
MGQNPGPTPEELEFISELFSEGYYGQDVLDKMADTDRFPERSLRYIADKRRGFNAAKKVRDEDVGTRADPIAVEQMKKHFKLLADMAGRLTAELTSPPLSDIFSEPIRYKYKFQDRLSWVVSETGKVAGPGPKWMVGLPKVKVSLPVEHEKPVSPIYRGLLSHLSTSDFTRTVEDIREWNKYCGFYLGLCHKLLKEVKAEVERTSGTSVPSSYSDACGPTVWFVLTLCVDILEGPAVSGDWAYDCHQISGGLYGLHFRGSTIAIAESKKDLEPYESKHRDLKESTAFSEVAGYVGDIGREVIRQKEQIAGELEMFALAIPIPGHCDICRPAKR